MSCKVAFASLGKLDSVSQVQVAQGFVGVQVEAILVLDFAVSNQLLKAERESEARLNSCMVLGL